MYKYNIYIYIYIYAHSAWHRTQKTKNPFE